MTPLLLSLVLLAGPEERFDHHGAVGLLIGGFGLRNDSNQNFRGFWGGGVEAGASFSVGWESSEIIAVGRATFGGPFQRNLPVVDTEVYSGYRGYFGPERWKTLVDLDLAVHFTPKVVVGPRVALGVQYELASVAGVYLTLGAQLGYGEVLLFKAELTLGFQFRSYLLE